MGRTACRPARVGRARHRPRPATTGLPLGIALALALGGGFASAAPGDAAPVASPIAIGETPFPLAAADGALMQQRGRHPLNALFGLPSVAARPVIEGEWQVSLEHANSFMGGVRGDEILLLDGESTELEIRHRRRFGRCWQGEAVLPFVAHSSGWADRAIDDWHQAFGLPDAERGSFPLFDLRYVWLDAEGRRRELERSGGGLGDVRIAVQRTLGCGARAGDANGPGGRGGGSGGASNRDGAVARIGLKLPTGSADDLLGSGAPDLYADLQSPVWRAGTRWRFGATAGAIATGESELFASQRPLVAYGSLGSEFRLHPRWRALVQLDWHTPFHDSALRELGEPAASLVVGVRHLARSGRFEFSIGEDALIDTAPDIVARLAWTWRPRPRLPRGPG